MVRTAKEEMGVTTKYEYKNIENVVTFCRIMVFRTSTRGLK
jgi:hypothetical protein